MKMESVNMDCSIFLDEVLDIEAKSILQNISVCPALFGHAIFSEQKQNDNAVLYIKGVLTECYDLGHLKIAISHDGNKFYGYSMIFAHPNPKYAAYLHKIFVLKEYRGLGIGSNILKTFLEDNPNVSLLCPEDKIKFYEKNGFSVLQRFLMPESNDFRLTNGLYSGLYEMRSSKEVCDAPIFFLNDKDIMNIISMPLH